jgi:NAD-dependent SIR2 family protein deacetylase
MKTTKSEDRLITFDETCCKVPERLLIAHGRGHVLFITGAGISKPAGLPDFRELTLKVYERLDAAVHLALSTIPSGVCNQWQVAAGSLRPDQLAEIKRFVQGDYDVALGMLERRIDKTTAPTTMVRNTVSSILRDGGAKPAEIHQSLIRLASRGSVATIVTTNFDLLLELAAKSQRKKLESYSLASIPRPGRSDEFSGVLHIHGALEKSPSRSGYCVVTDQDFGEFYLRRQVVPEFIYEAARLFRIVLVGYSANDPPMRYLLNAVAADGNRFDDLQERFAFVGTNGAPDPIVLEDWRARGIIPIPYESANGHVQLAHTLGKWASFSAINGKPELVASTIKNIARKKRNLASERERDLFEHLYRRGSNIERQRFMEVVTQVQPEIAWLDALLSIDREPRGTTS